MKFSKFFLLFIIVTTITALLFWCLQYFNADKIVLIPKFWLLFGFVAGITLVVYCISVMAIKRNDKSAAFILLSALVLRMLLSMILILFYLQKFKVDGVLFIINFFSIYFLYSIFEIYCLFINLRHPNKK